MDLLCLLVGSIVGVSLRLGPDEITVYVYEHLDGWLLFFSGILLANYLAGSYKIQNTFSRFNLVVTWLFSLIFALLVVSIISFAWFRILLGRGVFLLSVIVYSLLALALKLVVYKDLFRGQAFVCRTAILGTGPRADELRRMVEHELVLPAHKVVACINLDDDNGKGLSHNALLGGVAVVDATPEELPDLVRSLDVSLVISSYHDMTEKQALYPHLRRIRFEGTEVLTPLVVAEIYSGRVMLDMIDEESLMQASLESGLPLFARTKRVFDVAVSALALVLSAPLTLLAALIIKLSDPRSPVFYSQTRTGRFDIPFTIHKFRTMKPGAESESGPVWASRSDPRITAIGGVLRRFRLDEAPQFLNIIKGEMSLVGPRPERPEIIEELSEKIPFYKERHNVAPGLTGWAQVRYPYGASTEDSARKLEYDLYYIKHLSFSLDLQIILSTLRIVLFGAERNV